MAYLYPSQDDISGVVNSLPTGTFLLPICTTKERLAKMLSVLWEGKFLATGVWNDVDTPVDGESETLDHMIDVLKALSLIDNPQDSPCIDTEQPCLGFSPTSSMFDFQPQNPYTEPEYIPDGYLYPPFRVITAADTIDLALGYAIGDVVTDLSAFPVGSLPTIIPPDGFPRFRVSWVGEAVIELHLLQKIGGGLVFIQVDDDITTFRSLDANLDVIGIPPETDITFVEEVETTTPGSHWVDVTFVAHINDEIPFLHHGGGIRKIVVCSATVQCGDEMAYRLSVDGDGNVVLLENGVPVQSLELTAADFPALQGIQGEQGEQGEQGIQGEQGEQGEQGIQGVQGIQGIQGMQGIQGIPGVPGEDCNCEYPAPPPQLETPSEGLRCAVALNITANLRAIWDKAYTDESNMIANFTAGIGSVAAVAAFLFPPAAIGAAIAGILSIAFRAINDLESNAFDNDAEERYRCLLYCLLGDDGDYTDAIHESFALAIAADSLNPQADIVRQMLDGSPIGYWQWIANTTPALPDDDACACDCEPETGAWCYEFNFLSTDGGFAPVYRSDSSIWVASQGWTNYVPADGFNYVWIQKYIDLEVGSTVTRIEVDGNYTSLSGAYPFRLPGFTGYTYPGASPYTYVVDLESSPVTTPFNFQAEMDKEGNSNTLNFTRVRFEGTGINPFGSSNC